MNKTNNLRFKLTQTKIQEAFIELLETKQLRQITVQELCKKAKINRSTFYAHFLDIYDLMDKTEGEMSHKLLSLYEGTGADKTNFFSPEYITIFLKFIYQHKNYYRDFVHSHNIYPIKTGFNPLWHDVMRPYYQKLGIESENEMMYHLICFQAGLTAALKHWLDQGCKEEPEKLAKILSKYIIPG